MIITGGRFRSRKLVSPSEKVVKPTLSKVRESVFNILSSRINFEGKSFLDLFAGSGIVGFEAISRGFDSLTAIDLNAKNIALLKQNAQILGIDGKFIKYNALNFLKNPSEMFDVIYIDPPYDSTLANESLKLILKNNFLKEGGIVVVETQFDHELNISDFKLLKNVIYGRCKLLFYSKNLI